MLFLWVSFLNEAVFSYLVIPPPLKLLLQLFHHLCGHFSWSPNILTCSFLLIRGFQSHDPQVWSGTDYECSLLTKFSIQAPKNNAHVCASIITYRLWFSAAFQAVWFIYLFLQRQEKGCITDVQLKNLEQCKAGVAQLVELVGLFFFSLFLPLFLSNLLPGQRKGWNPIYMNGFEPWHLIAEMRLTIS